jgi:hypothetical protein
MIILLMLVLITSETKNENILTSVWMSQIGDSQMRNDKNSEGF